MPWIANNRGEKIHLYTREPHYDTPALCGEWKRGKVLRKPEDKTLSPDFEAWFENHASAGSLCEECEEIARELYFRRAA